MSDETDLAAAAAFDIDSWMSQSGISYEAEAFDGTMSIP